MNKIGKLLNVRTGYLNQVRTLIQNPPLPEEGGIKYHGFTYYPRNPNFKDPPYNPSPLFFVTRIKPMRCRNPIEKKALAELKIDGKVKDNKNAAIVKNTPDNCAILWKIKHLVKIVPIQLPEGKLKMEDSESFFLRDNGEILVNKMLKINTKRIDATEKFVTDKKKLNHSYIKEYLRLRWIHPFTKDL